MTLPDPWTPDLSNRVSRLESLKLGNVPAPVIYRVEQLCDLIDEADGIRPDRQVLVAALICAAQPDGYALARTWGDYRIAPVHEVLIGDFASRGSVDLTRYKRR